MVGVASSLILFGDAAKMRASAHYRTPRGLACSWKRWLGPRVCNSRIAACTQSFGGVTKSALSTIWLGLQEYPIVDFERTSNGMGVASTKLGTARYAHECAW